MLLTYEAYFRFLFVQNCMQIHLRAEFVIALVVGHVHIDAIQGAVQ